MTFGERLSLVRKRKKLSQAEVGKMISINGDAVGRYERNEVRPTIEMATKLAQALEVSLDYLVGNTDIEMDKATLNRVQEINKLSSTNKEHIYVTLDALIRDFKNKQAYAS
ncbi:MAG: helix-turn-helix transcriptional regulator [Bacteroidota bacterium]